MTKPTSAQLVLRVTLGIIKILLNILFYVVVVVLVMKASGITYDFTYQIFGQVTAAPSPGNDVKIQIKKGEATLNVAQKLEDNKLIKNKYSFYVKAKLQSHSIMPGTYSLNTSMTYDEIFEIITVPSDSEEAEE
ncbi:MAG: endolytic transglycosylase MltG [Anaerocolumna sp.]